MIVRPCGRPRQPSPLTRGLITLAFLITIVALPVPAAGQAAPQTQAEPTAGWDDGFFVQSGDGQHRLEVSVLGQVDGHFARGDNADGTADTFAVRRLRAGLRGRIAHRFTLVTSLNLAGGRVTVQDGYVDADLGSSLLLRAGRSRAPVGHERLQSITTLWFLERAFPTAIAPNRDVGIQLAGRGFDGRVEYVAALLNGAPDGAGIDEDTNDGKDVAGRVAVRPQPGLLLALSGSTGVHEGADSLPEYRTTIFRQPFFGYAAAEADGRLTRWSPYVAFHSGRAGGYAEFISSRLPVAQGEVRETVGHRGWQVAGSWLLAGSYDEDGGLVSPGGGTDRSGVVQLALRHHALRVDDAALTLGLAAPGSSARTSAWSVSLNWYINPFLLYKVQFERTSFDQRRDPRPAESVAAVRMQLDF